MPIAKITGQGLAAMALSVSLLWGLIVAESRVSRNARAERARVIRDLDRLQRLVRPQPVSTPKPGLERPEPGSNS